MAKAKVLPRDIKPLSVIHPMRKALTPAEATEYLKKIYGITVSINTVQRWAKRGERNADGTARFLRLRHAPGRPQIRYIHKDELDQWMTQD